MKQFLGILFFYTVTFHTNRDVELKYNPHILDYLKEKSRRYLNKDITKAEWELVKIYLKDLPTPNADGINPLTVENISTLIEAFDKVYGIENIDNIISIGEEVYEDGGEEIWNQIYNDLPKFISIVGSSNGLSVVLGRWLNNMEYNRTLIQRDLTFIELDI